MIGPTSPHKSADDLVEWYRANREAFEPATENVKTSIQQLLDDLRRHDKIGPYYLASRTKSCESLAQKLSKASQDTFLEIQDVHDLIGVRIVVCQSSEFDRIKDSLSRTFTILREIEKRPDDSRTFGYRSLHLIAQYPGEIRQKTNFLFEIQLRTFLQHGWAEIEHKYGYKAQIYNDFTKRVFATTAAVLELVEFTLASVADSLAQSKSQHLDEMQPTDTATVMDPVPARPATAQELLKWFQESSETTKRLVADLRGRGVEFFIPAHDSEGAVHTNWAGPLAYIHHPQSGISTVPDFERFVGDNQQALVCLVADVCRELNATSVLPIDLLWFIVILLHAREVNRDANAIQRFLDDNGIFPTHERENISTVISNIPAI